MLHTHLLGVLLITLMLARLGVGPAEAVTPLQLLRVTPSGEDVPAGQQLVLQFDRPMVPLGRTERRAEEVPIRITPALACTWRWLNASTLACQLDVQDAMTPATRYTVTLRPGLTARDGATLTETISHTFITQRPHIQRTWFQTWTSPGTPEILVVFDQPVRGATLEQHVYMQTADSQRVAVQVRPVKEYAERGWTVYPIEALPLDAHIQLQVEPGITSLQGPEPGVEQRVVVAFDTFPALHFLGVQCTTNDAQTITIAPDAALATQPRCHPLQSVALAFSVPVASDTVQKSLRVTPDLTAGRDDVDPWANVYTASQLSQTHRRGQTYTAPLPELLKAYTTYHLKAEPQQIQDEFGRVLTQGISMQFATDHRPPHYHLAHPISVLEQRVETHVPLIVTNLDTVHLHYEMLTAQGKHPAQDHTIPVDKAEDIAYAMPLKMRDLLPAASGAVQGTLYTTPEVGDEPQWFFSQVTPFNVHVKLGHYNTLVWVTRFADGLPVNEAQVQVYVDTFGTFDARPMMRAEAVTNADGIAMLAGITTLDPNLEVLNNWQHLEPHLFVQVRHDDDIALVPLTYDLMVSSYGPNRTYVPLSWERRYGHIHTWGTTAQGVYKAGDTVQYILYVRDQDNERFIAAPHAGYTLRIVDPTDKTVHEHTDLSLSDFGAHHGTFTVLQNGAVGWYRFVLSATFDGQEHTWEPLRVLISDFTPAPFRVTTELHGTLFAPDDTVAVTTQATLHAGGPYAEAPTRLTARVQGRPLLPQDPQATGFRFDVLDDTGMETVYQSEGRVDASGTLQTSLTIREAKALYGQLVVESAVRDDRGKYVASQATARYVGRDRYVGLRQPDWVLTAGTPAPLQLLVVDTQGTAVAGTPIQVKVEYLDTKAARVKGAGSAYLTRYVHTWVYVAACALISKTTPEVCTFTPDAPGTYKLTASIIDTQGREHSSSLQRWALGAGQVLWETTPGHGLQISPEKTTYKIGDTARYLIQNPYPGAKALVTIERYGVQHSWLQTFANSLEVVEVPITPEHLPGFYLSVVVISPRVDKPLEGGQVDLGKPAFRMGYVRVPVFDNAKELIVEVQPQQAVYKPRQTAVVDLSVRTRQGDSPPVELAVAVLDEAVFDLIAAGRDYFDPYTGFYTLDALDLRNYNLLTHRGQPGLPERQHAQWSSCRACRSRA